MDELIHKKSVRNLILSFFETNILFRYIFSGGLGAATDLAVLYFLVDILKLWYLTGAVIAFVISWLVSFTMQKFWTFKNYNRERTVLRKQAGVFFIIALFNLGLNTLLMYFFVDYLDLWYLSAQVITAILVATESFFAYKFLVFKSTVI